MSDEAAPALALALDAVRDHVERVLDRFLLESHEELAALHPEAAALVDELSRLIAAGGKRLRPAFCYWGYRAAGGEDEESIVRAAAALELLHTFALIHDDLMDEGEERRGVPSAHERFAGLHRERGRPGDPERFGRSAALLAGDLGAVLADRLLVDSGFGPDRLMTALVEYDRMRVAMAAGQFLDVGGAGAVDESLARRVAALKTGAYTVAGPLAIGAALAGARAEVLSALAAYGVPLGEAFQVRDDVLDAGEGGLPGARAVRVNELVTDACQALDEFALAPEAVLALRALALGLCLPEP
jgi:geranylgeranyl diphosphate synthase type I